MTVIAIIVAVSLAIVGLPAWLRHRKLNETTREIQAWHVRRRILS